MMRKRFTLNAAIIFVFLSVWFFLRNNEEPITKKPQEQCYRTGWNYSTPAGRTRDFGSMFRVSFADVQKIQRWLHLPKVKKSMWNREILMIVVSRPSSVSRRNVLRESWMNKENSKIIKDGRMQAMFLVGTATGDSELVESVMEEAKTFGDMILIDLDDIYENLSFKTLSLLLYGTNKASEFEIIGKIDDDVIFFPDRLTPMLENRLINSNSYSIYGHLSGKNETVLRNETGRWYVSEAAFNCPKYPEYAMGPYYMITSKAANLIIENSKFQNFMTVEDALITGILANDLGIQRNSLPMVFRHRFDNTNGKKILAWHMADRNDSQFLDFYLQRLELYQLERKP